MNTLFKAFEVAKPYRGRFLIDWLSQWIFMREADLAKANASFLTTMTTWVVRKFQERRKSGVPLGQLAKFALPETQEIDFTGALCAMVVGTLRKRGLIEADTWPTEQFRRLLDAFDRAPRI